MMSSDQDDGNHYTLLGVSRASTPKELRQAYLQLLITAHPDKGGSTELFAAIQHAYAVLSDPAEAAIYNEHLDRKNGTTSSFNTNNTAQNSTKYASTKMWSNGKGATAFVHGQTNSTPTRRSNPSSCLSAGQPTDPSTSPSIQEISTIIQYFMQKYRQNGDNAVLEHVAALHLKRSGLHLASGRKNHAAFDAQEAVRLWPGFFEAEEFLHMIEEEQPEFKKPETEDNESNRG